MRANDFKKQVVGKLCRWASKLFAYEYVIEKIPGESNILGSRKSKEQARRSCNGMASVLWQLKSLIGHPWVRSENSRKLEELKEDPDRRVLVSSGGSTWIPNSKFFREGI